MPIGTATNYQVVLFYQGITRPTHSTGTQLKSCISLLVAQVIGITKTMAGKLNHLATESCTPVMSNIRCVQMASHYYCCIFGVVRIWHRNQNYIKPKHLVQAESINMKYQPNKRMQPDFGEELYGIRGRTDTKSQDYHQ